MSAVDFNVDGLQATAEILGFAQDDAGRAEDKSLSAFSHL